VISVGTQQTCCRLIGHRHQIVGVEMTSFIDTRQGGQIRAITGDSTGEFFVWDIGNGQAKGGCAEVMQTFSISTWRPNFGEVWGFHRFHRHRSMDDKDGDNQANGAMQNDDTDQSMCCIWPDLIMRGIGGTAVIRTRQLIKDAVPVSVLVYIDKSMDLIASTGRQLRFWNLQTSDPLREIPSPCPSGIACMTTDRPGPRRLYLGTFEGGIAVMHIVTGQLLFEVKDAHHGPVTQLVVCPSTREVTSIGVDRRMMIFREKCNGLGLVLSGIVEDVHKKVVSACAVSPDAQLIATASGGEIRLWDKKDLRFQGGISDLEADVVALTFLPRTSCLLAGDSDGEITLWVVEKSAGGVAPGHGLQGKWLYHGDRWCTPGGQSVPLRDAVLNVTLENTDTQSTSTRMPHDFNYGCCSAVVGKKKCLVLDSAGGTRGQWKAAPAWDGGVEDSSVDNTGAAETREVADGTEGDRGNVCGGMYEKCSPSKTDLTPTKSSESSAALTLRPGAILSSRRITTPQKMRDELISPSQSPNHHQPQRQQQQHQHQHQHQQQRQQQSPVYELHLHWTIEDIAATKGTNTQRPYTEQKETTTPDTGSIFASKGECDECSRKHAANDGREVDMVPCTEANTVRRSNAGGSNTNREDVLSRLLIVAGSASGWVEAWRAEGLMAAAGVDLDAMLSRLPRQHETRDPANQLRGNRQTRSGLRCCPQSALSSTLGGCSVKRVFDHLTAIPPNLKWEAHRGRPVSSLCLVDKTSLVVTASTDCTVRLFTLVDVQARIFISQDLYVNRNVKSRAQRAAGNSHAWVRSRQCCPYEALHAAWTQTSGAVCPYFFVTLLGWFEGGVIVESVLCKPNPLRIALNIPIAHPLSNSSGWSTEIQGDGDAGRGGHAGHGKRTNRSGRNVREALSSSISAIYEVPLLESIVADTNHLGKILYGNMYNEIIAGGACNSLVADSVRWKNKRVGKEINTKMSPFLQDNLRELPSLAQRCKGRRVPAT
ncbi:unnamed protein product, partial [Sphacelaria rigidula]